MQEKMKNKNDLPTMYNRNYGGSWLKWWIFLQINKTNYNGKKRNFKSVTDGYTRPLSATTSSG